MEPLTGGVVIALLAVLAAELVNGWTDAPNAIATVVSTGVMTPRAAIAMAIVLNTLGAMSGTAVAATVGMGIVAPSALTIGLTLRSRPRSVTSSFSSAVGPGPWAIQ